MNARLFPLCVAAAILPASFASAETKETPAVAYTAVKVTVPAWDELLSRTTLHNLATGVSRDTVRNRLGRPKQVLSDNIWVYDNCQPNDSKAQGDGCDLLVISFNGNSISEMKFVNRPMAVIIAANAKLPQGKAYAADSK